jgi:hypothetical protein
MDQAIVIEIDGRIVGVAVRVRGGFMFFSTDPHLNELEATIFRRAEAITQRVAEIVQSRRCSRDHTVVEAPKTWSSSAIGVGSGNVMRLRPRQSHANSKPEPPDAA